MAKEINYSFVFYGSMCFSGSAYPSCGVIVGETQDNRYAKPNYHLIAEVEERSIKDLVRVCSTLDLKHQPLLWHGDTNNKAGQEFLWELHEELRIKYCKPGIISQVLQMQMHRGTIELTKSALVDMTEPYHFILPKLKELLNKENRRLFLSNRTAVKSQLKTIRRIDNISEIKLGDFPAVSALAISLIEFESRPDFLNEQAAKAANEPDTWDRFGHDTDDDDDYDRFG